MKEIKLLTRSGEGYYEEKRSRFLGITLPVSSEEEAQKLIAARRKEHPEARHHCYAFVIGARCELVRFSDDGEPSGTGGRPILDVLLGSGLHNSLVIVTRYFGGTLLGTGGLSRAYGAAAADALAKSGAGLLQTGAIWEARLSYSDYARADRSLLQQEIPRFSESFTEEVTLRLFLLPEQEEAVSALLADLTAGSCGMEKIEDATVLREDEGNKSSIRQIPKPF